MEETHKSRVHKIPVKMIAAIVLPAAFFVYLFFITTVPTLNDPDIWWHLATGKHIVEKMEIPHSDPFAYTSPKDLNINQIRGLRAHWLGQVLLYLPYKLAGLKGVGFLRGVLIILPMMLLYFWLRRKGANTAVALLVTAMPASMYAINLFYAFERPQGFSFSLALLTVLLLERLRTTRKRFDIAYVLLPLMTAVWSNIHAGFIVGNIIIIIYIGAEAVQATYRKYWRKEKEAFNKHFFAITILAIMASGLNPNGYHLFWEYFRGLANMFLTDVTTTLAGKRDTGDWVRSVVLEYRPLVYFYKNLGYKWLMYYWLFTGVLYISMLIKYWLRRKIELAELLTVSFVVLFANMYARGLMFSLSIMAAYMGKTVIDLARVEKGRKAVSWSVLSAISILTLLFGLYTFNTTPTLLKPGVTKQWITPWYPTRAVEFLKKNHIDPPMYNYYTWGGFLIWKIYPDYQVFIDGRALDNALSKTADGILKAKPGWQNKLDIYNINFIVIPTVFRESGYIIPMAAGLAYENQWKLIFIKNNSAIFVRNVPQNEELIKKYAVNKQRIFQEIIGVENLFLGVDPYNPVYNIAKADALMALSRFNEAKKIYERFPRRAVLQLRRLKQMGY
jgi:hypothetical protein